MNIVLLTTAYWPNLHYFYYVLNSQNVFIENHEHYQKQSFRNRTQILTANGILDLIVPVIKKQEKEMINTIEIAYNEPWQNKHWRAIMSAYKNSPYFEFFEDEIKQIYLYKPQYLLEYNMNQLKVILKVLRTNKIIELTKLYDEKIIVGLDMRNKIHPKLDSKTDLQCKTVLEEPYYQMFKNKNSFSENLSILDLLFNKGLDTLKYLNQN